MLVKAFSAEDNASALSLVSQVKSLNTSGAKLLQNIKSKQESMQWERYPIKFFRPYCKNPGERLQEYETPLRGMEMALVDNNPPEFPVTLLSSSEVKDSLDCLTGHISKQVKGTQFDLATVPESNAENAVKFLQKLQPVTLQDLSSFFFLFSLKLLLIRPSFSPLKDVSDCYGKLMGSLSNVVEYLHFVAQALRFLEQESATRPLWKESLMSRLDSDHLSLFRDYVGPSIKSYEEIISFVGSVSVLDKEFEKKKSSIDPELGKLPTSNNISGLSDEEIENKLKSFLEDSRQFVNEKDEEEDKDDEEEGEDNGEVMNSQVALNLSALAFCMRGIVRETKEIDKAIKELVQWENPSSPVNLHEISCKIRALAHTVIN
nr:uncharacterized protein LOC109193187 [Ipomoea batatas]